MTDSDHNVQWVIYVAYFKLTSSINLAMVDIQTEGNPFEIFKFNLDFF